MAEEERSSSIDESHISPLDRRDSLEKHLQERPEAQELKSRHILLDTTVAPALQAQQQELQRQKIADNLKKGLASRPEKEDLIHRNILPDSTAAPSLQSNQRELVTAMRKDSLGKHLQNRPQPEDLVKQGILDANELPTTQTS